MDISTCRIKKNIFHYSDLPYPQNECCLILAIDSDKQRSVMGTLYLFQQIFGGEQYIYDRLAEYINSVITFKKVKKSSKEGVK